MEPQPYTRGRKRPQVVKSSLRSTAAQIILPFALPWLPRTDQCSSCGGAGEEGWRGSLWRCESFSLPLPSSPPLPFSTQPNPTLPLPLLSLFCIGIVDSFRTFPTIVWKPQVFGTHSWLWPAGWVWDGDGPRALRGRRVSVSVPSDVSE